MENSFKNLAFIVVSSLSLSLIASDQMQDDQFRRETDSKQARAAQREQEELKATVAAMDTQADSKLEREIKSQQDAKKDAQDFEDGYAILCKLRQENVNIYNGVGLPKALQNLVFAKLQTIQNKGVLSEDTTDDDYWDTFIVKTNKFGGYILGQPSMNRLNIWDIKTKKLVHTLSSDEINIENLVAHLDSDGNLYLITNENDEESLEVRTLNSDNPVRILPDQSGERLLTTHADKHNNWYIISASEHQNIKIWNGATGDLITTIANAGLAVDTSLGETSIDSIIVGHTDSQGNLFVIAADKDIKIWNGKTGELVHTLQWERDDEEEVIRTLTTYNDVHGNWFVISRSVLGIQIWNVTQGKLVHHIKINDEELGALNPPDNIIHTDSQGNWYIIARLKDTVGILNGTTGEIIRTLIPDVNPPFDNEYHIINDIASCSSQNGNWFISALYGDSLLCVWDGFSGKCIGTTLSGDIEKILKIGTLHYQKLGVFIDDRDKLTLFTNSIKRNSCWEFGPGEFEKEFRIFEKEMKRREKFNSINDTMQLDVDYNWDYQDMNPGIESESSISHSRSQSSSSHSHEHLNNKGVKRKNEDIDSSDNTKKAKTIDTRNNSNNNNSNSSNSSSNSGA